jgi:hypothetical protein
MPTTKGLKEKVIRILLPLIKTKGKTPKDIDILSVGNMLLVKPQERHELKGIVKKQKKSAVQLVRELRKEREKKWKSW